MGESLSDLEIACSALNLATGQELIFLGVYGVRFHFNNRPASDRKDLINAFHRFERRKREEVSL